MPAHLTRTIGKMTSAPGANDNELVFTRVFEAPRELVWKCWTEADRLCKWWGPQEFTCRAEIDLRPGGAYRFVMVGPDGTDYPMHGVYLEIEPPERLVMTDTVEDNPQDWHDLLNTYRGTPGGEASLNLVFTILFAEQAGQTTVTIISRFNSAADRDATLQMGMAEGMSQSLDKLELLL